MFYVGWRGGYPSKKDLLSSTYLRGVYVAFNMIFKQGVKQGYCSRSPMDEVLKPEVDTKERHSLKQHEVEKLRAELNPTNIADVIGAFALEAESRQSEIRDMIWGYIDLIGAETLVPGNQYGAFVLVPLSFSGTVLAQMKGTSTSSAYRVWARTNQRNSCCSGLVLRAVCA